MRSFSQKPFVFPHLASPQLQTCPCKPNRIIQEEKLTNFKGSWEFLHNTKTETSFLKIDMFSFTVKWNFDQSYCLFCIVRLVHHNGSLYSNKSRKGTESLIQSGILEIIVEIIILDYLNFCLDPWISSHHSPSIDGCPLMDNQLCFRR